MTDIIDRERLARRRAMGQQMMGYINEHEAEWIKVSSQLEEACKDFQGFLVEAGATVNGSINTCVQHVLEHFAPSDFPNK